MKTELRTREIGPHSADVTMSTQHLSLISDFFHLLYHNTPNGKEITQSLGKTGLGWECKSLRLDNPARDLSLLAASSN